MKDWITLLKFSQLSKYIFQQSDKKLQISRNLHEHKVEKIIRSLLNYSIVLLLDRWIYLYKLFRGLRFENHHCGNKYLDPLASHVFYGLKMSSVQTKFLRNFCLRSRLNKHLCRYLLLSRLLRIVFQIRRLFYFYFHLSWRLTRKQLQTLAKEKWKFNCSNIYLDSIQFQNVIPLFKTYIWSDAWRSNFIRVLNLP